MGFLVGLLGFALVLFVAIGSVIAPICKPNWEKEYREFKQRLDGMDEAQRNEALQEWHTRYFRTPLTRAALGYSRYDGPVDWDGQREYRKHYQHIYNTYVFERLPACTERMSAFMNACDNNQGRERTRAATDVFHQLSDQEVQDLLTRLRGEERYEAAALSWIGDRRYRKDPVSLELLARLASRHRRLPEVSIRLPEPH